MLGSLLLKLLLLSLNLLLELDALLHELDVVIDGHLLGHEIDLVGQLFRLFRVKLLLPRDILPQLSRPLPQNLLIVHSFHFDDVFDFDTVLVVFIAGVDSNRPTGLLVLAVDVRRGQLRWRMQSALEDFIVVEHFLAGVDVQVGVANDVFAGALA